MSAFGKGVFEGSCSEGDMQNAKCQSIAPLATWLHVYSFSPVCRPTTNKHPKYSRHSVTDSVQTASPSRAQRSSHTKAPDDFHKKHITPYFFIYQLWEQNLLCLTFRSTALLMSFSVTKFAMYPLLENLLKCFLGSSGIITHVSCSVPRQGQ